MQHQVFVIRIVNAIIFEYLGDIKGIVDVSGFFRTILASRQRDSIGANGEVIGLVFADVGLDIVQYGGDIH